MGIQSLQSINLLFKQSDYTSSALLFPFRGFMKLQKRESQSCSHTCHTMLHIRTQERVVIVGKCPVTQAVFIGHRGLSSLPSLGPALDRPPHPAGPLSSAHSIPRQSATVNQPYRMLDKVKYKMLYCHLPKKSCHKH